MRVKVNEKLWNLRFVPNLSKNGDCDPPDAKGKEIRIWQGTAGQERLETVIHELLHAGNWHLAEEFVAEFATDAARILWRLGYRGTEE